MFAVNTSSLTVAHLFSELSHGPEVWSVNPNLGLSDVARCAKHQSFPSEKTDLFCLIAMIVCGDCACNPFVDGEKDFGPLFVRVGDPLAIEAIWRTVFVEIGPGLWRRRDTCWPQPSDQLIELRADVEHMRKYVETMDETLAECKYHLQDIANNSS